MHAATNDEPTSSHDRSDEERRFAALVSTSERRLIAYAVRRVDVAADAADVVAETYLVAWRRLADAPNGEEVVPWLFGIARRILANHYRGERRRLALADRLRSSLDEQESRATAPTLGQSDVSLALANLDADDRELLLLDAWDGLGRDEIAASLDISRAAVRTRMHRARKRLAEALAEIRTQTSSLPGTKTQDSALSRGRRTAPETAPRLPIHTHSTAPTAEETS